MQQQTKILFGGEESALKKSQVESIPVVADKKLSNAQVVGDFSLIPTNAIDQIGLIGSRQLAKRQISTATKSAKKGFRVVAKW